MARQRIMYMEDKSGELTGVARIGRVTFSKTGKAIHYGGRTFQKSKGFKANYVDTETGRPYWISGCKKDGSDRLYDERLPIFIDDDVRETYWTAIRNLPGNIDKRRIN